MASIINFLGSEEFPRLRIGIGRPAPGLMSSADWVLAPIDKEDAVLLGAAVRRAADAVEAWLRYGMEKAMSEYNTRA